MNRIKALRVEKQLSQGKLAEMLQVHQTAVSQWETGKTNPDMQQMLMMTKFFGVSMDYLMGQSGYPTQKYAPAVEAAEALRQYFWQKKGREATPEELQRLDDFAQVYIKGLDK